MFISSLQQVLDSFQVTCICIVVENKAYDKHLRGVFLTIEN